MRTTVNIDEDILRIAKRLAAERDVTLGAVLSQLARQGLHQTRVTEEADGLPGFHVSESAPAFTTEDVKRAEDEL